MMGRGVGAMMGSAHSRAHFGVVCMPLGVGGSLLPAHCWDLQGGGGRLRPEACREGGRRSSGVLAWVHREQPPFSCCLDAFADLRTPAPQDVWRGHICLLQMVSYFCPQDCGALTMDWLPRSCLPSRGWAEKQEGGSWGRFAHLSLTSLAGTFPRSQNKACIDSQCSTARERPVSPTTGRTQPRSPAGTAARGLPTRPRSEPSRDLLVGGSCRIPLVTQDLRVSTDITAWTWPPQAAGSVAQAWDAARTPPQFLLPTVHRLPLDWGRGTSSSFQGRQAPGGVVYALTEQEWLGGQRPSLAPAWQEGQPSPSCPQALRVSPGLQTPLTWQGRPPRLRKQRLPVPHTQQGPAGPEA